MQKSDLALDQLSAHLADALAYWRDAGGEALRCDWRSFDMMRLPYAVLPTTMVIDVADDMANNRYRFWGSGMTDVHGRDMTDRSPYDLDPPEFGNLLKEQHAAVIDEKAARAMISGFDRREGFHHVHSTLWLPLSDDGTDIHHLVVIVDLTATGRAFIDEQRRGMRD